MSTIYAPVNSVTCNTKIKTTIPTDFELTYDELSELGKLEYQYKNGMLSEVRRYNRINVMSTSNVGIHFFCLANSFALLELAKNPNIDPLIVMLLNHKLNMLDRQAKKDAGRKTFPERYALLINPSILGNFELFKKIFDSIKKEDKGTIVNTLIFNVDKAKVEIVIYIMSWVAEADKSRILKYVDVIKSRDAEIEEWAAKNKHDIAGLPISWILAMYGISEH